MMKARKVVLVDMRDITVVEVIAMYEDEGIEFMNLDGTYALGVEGGL